MNQKKLSNDFLFEISLRESFPIELQSISLLDKKYLLKILKDNGFRIIKFNEVDPLEFIKNIYDRMTKVDNGGSNSYGDTLNIMYNDIHSIGDIFKKIINENI